jgi:hypothetical protein
MMSGKDQTLPTYRSGSLSSKRRILNLIIKFTSLSSDSMIRYRSTILVPAITDHQHKGSLTKHWKDCANPKPSTMKYRNENGRQDIHHLYRRNTSSDTSTLAIARQPKRSKYRGIA